MKGWLFFIAVLASFLLGFVMAIAGVPILGVGIHGGFLYLPCRYIGKDNYGEGEKE